jgi:predicted amidohydrolase YtcJ
MDERNVRSVQHRRNALPGVGAAVVAQPYFLRLSAISSAPAISGLKLSPLRWLLDAGVRVAGSSDFPVAGFAPLDGIR